LSLLLAISDEGRAYCPYLAIKFFVLCDTVRCEDRFCRWISFDGVFLACSSAGVALIRRVRTRARGTGAWAATRVGAAVHPACVAEECRVQPQRAHDF